MKLSPDTLAAAYAFLCGLEPMSRWGLPSASEISFAVETYEKDFARCRCIWTPRRFLDTRHCTIGVSNVTVQTIDRLFRAMAHEMIHVKQVMESRSGSQWDRTPTHGRKFASAEREIAKALNWEYPLQ